MGVLGLLGLTRFEYKNHRYGGGFFIAVFNLVFWPSIGTLEVI